MAQTGEGPIDFYGSESQKLRDLPVSRRISNLYAVPVGDGPSPARHTEDSPLQDHSSISAMQRYLFPLFASGFSLFYPCSLLHAESIREVAAQRLPTARPKGQESPSLY